MSGKQAHGQRLDERDISEKNWAGNLVYSSQEMIYPSTSEALQTLVRANEPVKALGSRHSFNTIADSRGIHVSMRNLRGEMSLDRDSSTVSVPAGVRYGELGQFLHRHGYALPAMASLPHISVVGGCATATHGSGDSLGNLATSVQSFELVTGTGELRVCSRAVDGDAFDGMVVHLGALGVVTSVTLRVIPAFSVAQTIFEQLPLTQLISNFDAITSSAYSVSLFTDWRTSHVNQVWLKDRTDSAASGVNRADFYGARAALVPLHPIAGVSAESCTEQLGIPGPWHERLPHFRLSHQPSFGVELQSEYFVRREHAAEAINRLHSIRERFNNLLLISEIRTVASDSLWLSPCHRGDSVGLHCTWQAKQAEVLAALRLIEQHLSDLEPIPHWGKLFTLTGPEIQSRYKRHGDFCRLVQEFDPRGRMKNDFLARYILGEL